MIPQIDGKCNLFAKNHQICEGGKKLRGDFFKKMEKIFQKDIDKRTFLV